MSIWLGFPEESSNGDGSGTDNIQTLIDEIQAKDEEIDQSQDQMVTELQTSDQKLKKTEKEEFITEAELDNETRVSPMGIEPISVTDDTTWSEILRVYERVWGLETGPKKDSLEDKVKHFKVVMDKVWQYGNQSTPHGWIAVDTQRRIDDAYKGETKTKIDETATAILEISDKMNELETALEDERAEVEGGSGGGNANQDILEAVKSMKAIKINTVTNVITDDNRWLVEHQIPGRAGVDSEVSASVIQDLGRRPGKLSFKGILTSETENRQDLHKKIETLKWFYKQRKPLFFSSRFVNQLEATKVVIEKLNFEENTNSPYAVDFNCVLKEYSEVDWKADTDMVPAKLTLHTQHWADYQALSAMIKYRYRFIEPGETVNSSEIGKRIASHVFGFRNRIKYLATEGVGETVAPSDLLAPTANLNEAVEFYDGSVEEVVDTQESGVDGVLEGTESEIDSAVDSSESDLGTKLETISDNLNDKIDSGAENIDDVISEGATTIKDWINSASEKANGTMDKAQDKLGTLLDDVDTKLSDGLKKSQDKLKDVLGKYGVNIPDSKLDEGRQKIE